MDYSMNPTHHSYLLTEEGGGTDWKMVAKGIFIWNSLIFFFFKEYLYTLKIFTYMERLGNNVLLKYL